MTRALQQRNLRIRTKDLRHLYATRMREHIPGEMIDLIQGRIGESVFLRYYYEPFLKEIREKVLKAAEPFTMKLLSTLN